MIKTLYEHLSITIVSSNINEVTRAILNSFIHNFHNHKQAQNAYKQIKPHLYYYYYSAAYETW